jgi:hypothetical protein
MNVSKYVATGRAKCGKCQALIVVGQPALEVTEQDQRWQHKIKFHAECFATLLSEKTELEFSAKAKQVI